MDLQLEFLGTGTSQGVPVIACECPVCLSNDPFDKRTRTSARVLVDGHIFLIDTGPDLREQLLSVGAKRLDAVLMTHEHMDHIAGMDEVRTFNFLQKIPMPVYGDAKTLKAIRRVFEYVFSKDKYPGAPDLQLHEIGEETFSVNGIDVLPIQVLHHKMPVLGFRIGDLTYITDANYISEAEIEKVKGSKVLVLNALRKKKHLSHFNLEEAIELSIKIGAEKTYLTHISHVMGKHEDVTAELPDNLFIAYDGLKVDV